MSSAMDGKHTHIKRVYKEVIAMCPNSGGSGMIVDFASAVAKLKGAPNIKDIVSAYMYALLNQA